MSYLSDDSDPLRFDFGACDDVVSALKVTAEAVGMREGVRQERARLLAPDFRGFFADSFDRALTDGGHELSAIRTELIAAAQATEALRESAREEDLRRRQLREWQARQTEREARATALGMTVSLAEYSDPRPHPAAPAPAHTARAVRMLRSDLPRPGAARAGAGRIVSARPDELRAFVALTRELDADISGYLLRVRGALEDIAVRCQWGHLDGSAIVGALQRWLQQNGSDADWLEQVAARFENAGAGGELRATVWMVLARERTASSPPTADELLALLVDTPPERLKDMLKADPGLAALFWDNPPDPVLVAAWWRSLPAAQQKTYTKLAPGIIGNLPGVPYAARDRANRIQVADWSNRNGLTAEQKAALEQVKNALEDDTALDGAPVQLVAFHFGGPVPMVAIGYGDLDTADTTTWCVPGMGFDASEGTEAWSEAARNLHREQKRLDPTRSRASAAWLCYDAPRADPTNLDEVLSPKSARAGAVRLAAELDGNHAVRAAGGSGASLIGVVAHSYGTTTAADALVHTRTTLDSFTMIGSAGIDTDTVPDLAGLHVTIKDGRPAIYTTNAQMDVVAPSGAALSGRANPNPANASLAGSTIRGAQSFSSDGTDDLKPVRGHDPLGKDHAATPLDILFVTPPEGHGYFDSGTEALRNMAATSIGRPDLVPGGLTLTDHQPSLASTHLPPLGTVQRP